MKKISLIVLPVLTILLEALPLGAVCIFAPSPTERITETFSYFSLIPFGYANFAPLITAILTIIILLLSLISRKKNNVLMYGLNYYTPVGAFITIALAAECVLVKIQQK